MSNRQKSRDRSGTSVGLEIEQAIARRNQAATAVVPVVIKWPLQQGMMSFVATERHTIPTIVGPLGATFDTRNRVTFESLLARMTTWRPAELRAPAPGQQRAQRLPALQPGALQPAYSGQAVCPRCTSGKTRYIRNIVELTWGDRGRPTCGDCHAPLALQAVVGAGIDHELLERLISLSVASQPVPVVEPRADGEIEQPNPVAVAMPPEIMMPTLWGVWVNGTEPGDWQLPADAPELQQRFANAWAQQGCSIRPLRELLKYEYGALSNAVSILALPPAPVSVGYLPVTQIRAASIQLTGGLTVTPINLQHRGVDVDACLAWRCCAAVV